MNSNNNINTDKTVIKAIGNNIKRMQVRQLRQVNRKIGKLVKKIDNNKLPRDPIEFRKMKPEEVVSKLNDYRNRTRSQYLYSMIHPDYAVTEGVQVKMYSDVPVPTSSIGIRSMYQIKTSKNGTFLLSWSPNFLATNQDIEARFGEVPQVQSSAYSNIIVCTNDNMTGETASEAYSQYQLPCFIPSVMLQKYRLVSAILKVKYNGSVLNQAGTMISCATYDNIPVHNVISSNVTSAEQIMTEPTLAQQDTVFSRYTDFSLIRNGLWNYSQNITADANGLECLYVPTDPTSNMFYDLGSYYGSTLSKISNVQSSGVTIGESESIIGDSGAQLTYMVAGYNMPKSETCIQIEVFANFEVIADPSVAPLLRSSLNQYFDWNDNRRVKELFNELSQKGFIRRGIDFVKEKFPQFAKATVTWGPRLLPLIAKLI